IKGKYSESAPLYAVLLAAGLVVAVVVFFIVYNSLGGAKPAAEKPSEQTAQSTKAPDTPDVAATEEMLDAATELIKNNYQVLSLYYTKGMEHKDEPYGNVPEDGYYTAISSDFSSIEELEKLVDSTFAPEQAKIIKEDSLGYGPIYKTRDNGDLGIIQNFTPMPYTRSWDNPGFKINPVSETECSIDITIHEKESGEEVVLNATMIETSEGWRLSEIVF
ncbi:MAG: hypothetical protein ACI4KR_01200, partial [Ruminiclostridium sp.]